MNSHLTDLVNRYPGSRSQSSGLREQVDGRFKITTKDLISSSILLMINNSL